MTWLRNAVVVIALLVTGSLVVPTTGFSSSATDRSMHVAVVSDDRAYLGIHSACRDNSSQLTITNRLAAGTSLDVTIAVNGTTESIQNLAAGEFQTREFDAVDADDPVRIGASGNGVAIDLVRTLPTC